MTESTLSLGWSNYMNDIAQFLRYPRESDPNSPTSWSTAQKDRCDRLVQLAWARVVAERNWSWLTPRSTLIAWATTTGTESGSSGTTFKSSAATFHATMVGHSIVMTTSAREYEITAYTSTTQVTIGSTYNAGDDGDTFTITADGAYRLPDTFGGIYGNRLFFPANEGAYEPLPVMGEGTVSHLLQISSSTGRPTQAALRPLESTGASGQRWDLLAWRIPDTDYTLSYRRLVLVGQLTNSAPYPLGGMLIGYLVRAACLAAAELERDGQEGDHEKAYQRHLATAVTGDRNFMRAKRMGTMRDPNFLWDVDPEWAVGARDRRTWDVFSIEGV